jgi:hypothetical protein
MCARVFAVAFAMITWIAGSCVCAAQQAAPGLSADYAKPEPVLSGGIAFVPTWDAGKPDLDAIAAPVLLIPLGNNFVVESRTQFEGNFQRRNGTAGDFTGTVAKSLDYAELDYIGNAYVTVTVGRFLTPFNIFNERLYPAWIRNTQTDPLIFPMATGSDDGVMLRGGVAVTQAVSLHYSTYFSALANRAAFESERHAGVRSGIFLPRRRLEVGGSVQHELQGLRGTRYGLYLEWQPQRIAFDLRAEAAKSSFEGSGFWLEGAYRFRNLNFAPLRRAQLVARTQAYYTGSAPFANPDLPNVDTKRTEFGVNYYLNDGWKALASYGRTFTSAVNSNIWTIGMTYRFVFPLGFTQ